MTIAPKTPQDDNCSNSPFKKGGVCELHRKANKVIVGGREMRFSQRSTTLKDLSEFEGDQRSTRDELKRKSEMRKRAAAAPTEKHGVPSAPPAPSLVILDLETTRRPALHPPHTLEEFAAYAEMKHQRGEAAFAWDVEEDASPAKTAKRGRPTVEEAQKRREREFFAAWRARDLALTYKQHKERARDTPVLLVFTAYGDVRNRCVRILVNACEEDGSSELERQCARLRARSVGCDSVFLGGEVVDKDILAIVTNFYSGKDVEGPIDVITDYAVVRAIPSNYINRVPESAHEIPTGPILVDAARTNAFGVHTVYINVFE